MLGTDFFYIRPDSEQYESSAESEGEDDYEDDYEEINKRKQNEKKGKMEKVSNEKNPETVTLEFKKSKILENIRIRVNDACLVKLGVSFRDSDDSCNLQVPGLDKNSVGSPRVLPQHIKSVKGGEEKLSPSLQHAKDVSEAFYKYNPQERILVFFDVLAKSETSEFLVPFIANPLNFKLSAKIGDFVVAGIEESISSKN